MLTRSALLTVPVNSVVAVKMPQKAIIPMTNLIGFEKASSNVSMYVKIAAIAEENRILAEDTQSKDTPKRFLMKRKLMNRLGRPAVREATIKPITPKFEINRKPNGKPMTTVRMDSFMLYAVNPCPFIKLPALRLPKAE